MLTYNEIVSRYKTAKSDWENWRSLYEEAYEFTFPNKNPYWDEDTGDEGSRKNIQVFDNTLNVAARKLVSKLHANLVPPSLQWFELSASPVVTKAAMKKQLAEFLQVVTSIVYNAINSSNFDLVINEFFHDLIIGTAALQIFPDGS